MEKVGLLLLVVCMAGSAQAVVYDFQSGNSPHTGATADGAIPITESTPLYSAGQGYGLLYPAQLGRSRGGTDLLLRDFLAVETSPASAFAFRVDLAPGEYRVQSWQGDMDYSKNPIRMILSLQDAKANHVGALSEDRLYGASSHNPTVARPGTFLTTFVDSGTPGAFNQPVPSDEGGSGLNLALEAREFLQVDDTFQVDSGSLIFLVESGAYNRLVNAIQIDLIPEPATLSLLGLSGLLLRRKKAVK